MNFRVWDWVGVEVHDKASQLFFFFFFFFFFFEALALEIRFSANLVSGLFNPFPSIKLICI